MDLIEFLRARLDEDEAAARAATSGRWTARDLGDHEFTSADGKGWWWVWREGVEHYAGVLEVDHENPEAPVGVAAITDYDHGATERADAEHIARWDPARVLAEIAAKRQVIEYAEATEDVGLPSECWVLARYMVRALAQPYADHPDFDPAWLLVEA